MRQHYLTARRVDVNLLLRLEGLRGEGPLHKSEMQSIADIIRDLSDALHFAQRDVFTLQHDLDRLQLENEFLTRELAGEDV